MAVRHRLAGHDAGAAWIRREFLPCSHGSCKSGFSATVIRVGLVFEVGQMEKM